MIKIVPKFQFKANIVILIIIVKPCHLMHYKYVLNHLNTIAYLVLLLKINLVAMTLQINNVESQQD